MCGRGPRPQAAERAELEGGSGVLRRVGRSGRLCLDALAGEVGGPGAVEEGVEALSDEGGVGRRGGDEEGARGASVVPDGVEGVGGVQVLADAVRDASDLGSAVGATTEVVVDDEAALAARKAG